MEVQEGSNNRKERFKAMSSAERKVLIRAKMEAEGLEEGSGVPGKDLSSYDRDEIWDLIQVTRCFPEMQTHSRPMKSKALWNKKSLIAWVLFAIALIGGVVLYYRQYPSPETRRELTVDGIFVD